MTRYVAGAGAERLLEREREMAALEAELASARSGTGRLILLEGAAGIGKTTLLRAFAERGRSAGIQVLTARGGTLERDLAWGTVRGLFSPVLERAAVDERRELLAGAAGLAQAPLGRGSMEELGSVDLVSSALHGLYWLIANVAERAPLMVIVDDAHWVDAASLRYLTYLAARV